MKFEFFQHDFEKWDADILQTDHNFKRITVEPDFIERKAIAQRANALLNHHLGKLPIVFAGNRYMIDKVPVYWGTESEGDDDNIKAVLFNIEEI